MDITSSTSAPLDRSSSIATSQRSISSSAPSNPASFSDSAPMADRASISDEARSKLAEEDNLAAEGQDPNATPGAKPSETKKFVYGTLGLDRPSEKVEEAPKDGYTYGRFAAAGITLAALIALV
ncbi:hypothetical protein KIK84_06075 [Curvibacter sp. CHRR-16]|uniref:hypothetical protein n=1 Tax=Curvibacter sp. CHRR-16 TaxID=2835872 RepID=UPI001BDA3B43|nr:hypothetical protein [Curvibacter sp. CHRR-16]MBT0569886.1 hypothetical protein [Curvibacter sp. CHRR-16]